MDNSESIELCRSKKKKQNKTNKEKGEENWISENTLDRFYWSTFEGLKVKDLGFDPILSKIRKIILIYIYQKWKSYIGNFTINITASICNDPLEKVFQTLRKIHI